MLTPFGKALRKYRIDQMTTLGKMANQIGISSAYLSALETGKRNLTPNLLDKISNCLHLNDSQCLELKKLADQSRSSLQIDLSTATCQSKEMAAAFARKFPGLSSDEIKKIKKILDNRNGKQ